jgi:hypothetical protein
MRILSRRKVHEKPPPSVAVIRIDDAVRFIRLGIARGYFDQAEDAADALEAIDSWDDLGTLKGETHARH